MALVARDQATEVLAPGEEAFDLPPPAIAPALPPVVLVVASGTALGAKNSIPRLASWPSSLSLS